jgi:ABC-type multidrug transport system fused ATPase/permease subunit
MLRGTREIKLHAIEQKVSHEFDSHIDRIRVQSTTVSLQQHLEHLKPEIIQYTGFGILYGFGAWSCIYRTLTVGEFFAFVSSVNLLMGPLMTMMQLNLTKANAEAGLERIQRILDAETTIQELQDASHADYDRAQQNARNENLPFLEFENVSFQYGPDEVVLREISCRIPQGCRVALVGPSGSGKTTFARLVMRLYDPMQGRILLNGVDIRHFALQDLRSRFGVVSQDTFLFQTSILENIRVANPEVSGESVRQAMDRAHVTEFVDLLPGKEHTLVGENGFTLSGGQKQRIAIARAILGTGRTLIFDEATSALDNESERKIQHAIDTLSRERNTLIIAHRLSTIRHADLILVFDQGRIVQHGSYDELASKPGRFSQLLQEGAA